MTKEDKIEKLRAKMQKAKTEKEFVALHEEIRRLQREMGCKELKSPNISL